MIRRLINFFKPKERPKLIRHRIRKGLTLAEWKKNNDLIRAARQLWNDPTFQDMMSVVHNHIPSGSIRLTPINPTEAAQDLGRIQGYQECIHVLNSLSEFPVEFPEIEADYGADEILKDQPE